MAFAQEVFLEIMIVILSINGGILMVTELSGQVLITPFNTSISITGINNTSIYPTNPTTSGVIANVTTNVHNSTTGTGTLLNQITSNSFYILSVLWMFWQFISGGFIWSMLGLFGFPAVFVQIITSILVILGARSAVYYFAGR